MKIGVLKENDLLITSGDSFIEEKRVSLTPEIAKDFIKQGLEVLIETNAGELCGWSNEEYQAFGAKIVNKAEVLKCEIILKVNPLSTKEISLLKPNQIVIANFKALNNLNLLKEVANTKVEAYSLDLMPRISRAQSMDILSSQSNLLGYQAVIHAAYYSNLVFPMMMTSAGTIAPAKVFVIGAGVAGLQAIATAKRLGGVVSAYDVRLDTKEQVESLGGKFLIVAEANSNLTITSSVSKVNSHTSKTAQVYAKEMNEDYKAQEKALLLNHISKQDVVITTALIQGKKSPILIDEEILKKMKPGSVIIDLAIENGGNCLFAEKGKIVEQYGVKIIGLNLINFIPKQASQLFGKNIYNYLIPYLDKEAKLIKLNQEDQLIKGCLVTKNGEIVHDLLKSM